VDPRTQAATAALSVAAAGEPVFVRQEVVGDRTAENRVVAGDNLLALAWLREEFEGRFRCVYLDPPYNTGRTFKEYDDARSPAEWRAFMRERLLAVVPLMAPDGALFFEIDDSEVGQALALCDETFGRAARVSTVTLVRSASTGHKAKNRGLVNVTDFILVYERSPGAWACRPQKRVRRGYDGAYRTYLVNPTAPHAEWRFESLGSVVAKDRGYATTARARKGLGPSAFEDATSAFALQHAAHIVRFAQPRYEAVSRAAQRAIDASKADPETVMCLVRPGFPDLVLRGGNRVLFLASKVAPTKDGPRLVEPLTNVWDDIPFQGIAREGGVVFQRNKKPERLLERILTLATDEGDWVLDPFLGSGTTAAVAEKMGRRWVGIEEGEVLRTLAVPRLERVIRGEDMTGITKSQNHDGGGGFSVYS
jgi:adenine-specific DNA-methyltransferase